MTMFSQRTVQGAVDAVAPQLSEGNLKHLLNRLRDPQHRVAAEWEVVCIATLMRFATVKPETQSGTRRPDLHVVAPQVEFLADIRTISDASAEEANPMDFFSAALRRTARRIGLSGAGLYIEVEPSSGNGSARVLALPQQQAPEPSAKRHRTPFLRRVARNPTADDVIAIAEGDVRLRVRFDAKSPYAGGTYRSYKVPRTLESNPLFSALRAKARQLREAKSSLLKGIVICDGDCETLRRADEKVVERFFSQHRETVSFVVALTVVPVAATPFGGRKFTAVARLFWNRFAAPDPSRAHVAELIDRWVSALPQLVREPANAFRHAAWAKNRPEEPHYGALHFNAGEYRFAARTLVRLIAGDLSFEQFAADHQVLTSSFRSCLTDGKRLQGVRLELAEDNDDDVAVASFGAATIVRDATLAIDALHRLMAGAIAHDEFAKSAPALVVAAQAALSQGKRVTAVQIGSTCADIVADGHDAAIAGIAAPRGLS